MKSTKRLLYLQWIGVTAFITIVCVIAGNFLFHYLSSREEFHNKERLIGPVRQRIEVMAALVASRRLSPEEVFAVVDRAQEAPFPEKTELLNGNKEVIATHASQSSTDIKVGEFQEFPLGENHFYRVYMDPHRPFGPPPGPHHGRGPGGPGGRPPRMPPGFFLIASTVTGVSILIGVGLSVILLTYYLRKRARQVERVMTRIQEGDLAARFDISQTDEVGELMTRFNGMAAEIEKLVTNLRETEEARKKMLQELAHDLRTPVASMKNLQEIIFSKGDILDREKKGQLQNLAMKEVAYFERLVEDLLFLSGVNDPRYSQGRREVLLTNLVEEEAEFFRAGNIRVECNLQSDVRVKGEELLLRRLLRNALSNAVRYARNEVFVTLTNTQGGVELRVRDDGPGLSPNDLETFGDKKFSRDLTHSSGHISVGLGSVIMKKIMHLHDGELTIKNSNPGAEIIFRWPL